MIHMTWEQQKIWSDGFQMGFVCGIILVFIMLRVHGVKFL